MNILHGNVEGEKKKPNALSNELWLQHMHEYAPTETETAGASDGACAIRKLKVQSLAKDLPVVY